MALLSRIRDMFTDDIIQNLKARTDDVAACLFVWIVCRFACTKSHNSLPKKVMNVRQAQWIEDGIWILFVSQYNVTSRCKWRQNIENKIFHHELALSFILMYGNNMDIQYWTINETSYHYAHEKPISLEDVIILKAMNSQKKQVVRLQTTKECQIW